MRKQTAVIHYSLIVLFATLLTAVNVVAGSFSGLITQYVCGMGIDYNSDSANEAKAKGKAMAKEIEQQGAVLLKNDNDVLPLLSKKVNIFGWGGSDSGFIYQGGGSGAGSSIDRVSFTSGLTNAGIEYNSELKNAYEALGYSRPGYTEDISISYRMFEAPETFYTNELMSNAKSFSDTALIVLSRTGLEGTDLPKCQYDMNGVQDLTRKYSELSPLEEVMIEKVTANFSNVIVILNNANPMELGFLENEKIDAALAMFLPGNFGSNAIGEILLGDITPSGKLVDTYAYDMSTAATYANAGADGPVRYGDVGGSRMYYNDYAEGIYTGYRWYETADQEGYWSGVSNSHGQGYEGVVQFPFGYGESYTDFEWTLESVSIPEKTELTKNGKITFEVFVENVGDKYSGRDVVELYYSAPYHKGGIEKSSLELGAFAKTGLLKPGEGEKLTLTLNVEDMKSYDCYDVNNNGFVGYEVEGGDYTLSIRKDAHTLAKLENIGDDASYSYSVPTGGFLYEFDAVTGTKVTNQFTTFVNYTSGAYSTINEPEAANAFSIDGTDSGADITYLTRADFAGTLPQKAPTRNIGSLYDSTWVAHAPRIDTNDVMPVYGSKDTSVKLDDVLGLEYDDPLWDTLISQLDLSTMGALCAHGGFGTNRIASINKPKAIDLDGPSGLSTTVTGSDGGHATNYPCETVLASTWDWKEAYKFGLSVGEEAEALNVDGWYAPGANMHRSPLGGRNFEYYSEDAYLSGIMCAYTVKGNIEKGLYSYIKHFAVNDSDTGRNGEYRFLSEQSLRQIYLKPFEIAVKVGGANAMMASVDRIGTTRATGSYALLTQVLRNEWGFRGSVITDYYQGGNVNDCDEGIRAGNDLMLSPTASETLFDDLNSATTVIALQKSSKNILYTYLNTQYISVTTQGLDLSTAIGTKTDVFAWWIPALAGVDTLLLAGCFAWGFVVFKKTRKPKKV